MIPFVILKPICFNRPLAVLVRDAKNTEGDLFFLIGRRRSGKNLSPSGNFSPPQGGLMIFICRRLPANEKYTFLCELCASGERNERAVNIY